jgi:hypothetical protein
MIELSTPRIPVNGPEHDVQLTRDDVWQGLLWKAENPMPFIPQISDCEVLERFDDGFLREILHVAPGGSEKIQERIILDPKQTVTFIRITGDTCGRIINAIEDGADGELYMRFHFILGVNGFDHGSPQERDYERGFSGGYLQAVDNTLAAVRHYARTGELPEARSARV